MRVRELISGRERKRIETILGVWAIVALLSWVAFVLHGYPLLDSLFEVISALTDAGLTMGIIKAGLPVTLKLVTIIDMVYGKFSVIALVVLSVLRWHKHKGGKR